MSGSEGDFQPKILIVGNKAHARAPLINGYLTQHVTRYGIISVGVEPAGSVARGVLQLLEMEGISPEGIDTGPLGRAVNENVRLICFVSKSVKQNSPVIAAPCEKLVFDLPDPAAQIEQGKDPRTVFFELRDLVKENVIPSVLEELQANGS